MMFSLSGPEMYMYGRIVYTIVYAGINFITEVNNK
jgi:hypothetical protein